MNLLLLLGIGIAVYAIADSGKKSSNSSTSTKEEENKLKAELALGEVNFNRPSGSSYGIGALKGSKCNAFQYEQGGQCITFWTPQIEETMKVKILGKADLFRKTEIINAINQGRNEPLIATEILLCQDGVRNEIIKSSILEVYQNIKAEDLPPNKDKPLWIKRVWDLSKAVYNKNLCV